MAGSNLILPFFTLLILIVALIRKVNAYDCFIQGVKEGFSLFNEVFPAILGMMFAINMLRASGVLNALATLFGNVISSIPNEMWAMILFRPFSGTASMAIMIDIFKNSGVDSFAGIMASIVQGSTDTTLYVITLYFASVGVKNPKFTHNRTY